MIRVNSQSFTLSSTLDRKNGKTYEAAQSVPKSQTFPSHTLPIQHSQNGHSPHSPDSSSSYRNHQQIHYQPPSRVRRETANSGSDESLLLHYVTERILASVLPPRRPSSSAAHHQHLLQPVSPNGGVVAESASDDHERELIVMLEQKHGKNYRLFDLESCIATVTLEKLCELCKRIDSWLGNGREKVVVLQDRGDRQRLGAAIAAYLEYQRLCGSNFPSRATTPVASSRQPSVEDLSIAKKWLNLDIYSMQKFLTDVVGPQRIPSHRRYLQYFSGLLSGAIKINAAPVFLKYVSIESPPSWFYYDMQSPNSGEWRCFIKVYESLRCVFTSEVYVVPITTRNFVIQIGNLRLRGDVMIRGYQLVPPTDGGGVADERELIFSGQFHTCAVGDRTLVFKKQDLDYACEDSRFPDDHKVSVQFSNGADKGYVFQSPLVRTENGSAAVMQWDSVGDVNSASARSQQRHLQGPLDGSLYATIAAKSPRSPPSVILSPPVEFRESSATSPLAKSRFSGSTQSLQVYPTSSSSHYHRQHSHDSRQFLTPTPTNQNTLRSTTRDYSPSLASTVAESVHFQRAYSTPPGQQPHCEDDEDRYATINQKTINQQVARRHPQRSTPHQFVQEIRIVEEFQRPGAGGGGGQAKLGSNARDSLTLSMDSGISSSGLQRQQQQQQVANRSRDLPPASSVSPSTVSIKSSQISVQDEQQQHQELDDILSDMLSNVKDIPDIGRTINRSNSYYTNSSTSVDQRLGQQHRSLSRSSLPAQSYHHQQSSSHAVYEDLGGYQHHHNQRNGNGNSARRTPSYQSADNQSVISKTSTLSTVSSSSRNHHPHTYVTGEQYETASTTTTLTPPPSESGRETPLGSSNLHLYGQHQYQHQRPQSRPHLYIGDEEERLRHQSQSKTRLSTSTTTKSYTMDLQQQKYRREQSPGQESSQSVVDHQQSQQQHQVIYATPQRQQTVELISVTSDESETGGGGSNRTSGEQSIPYHAREYAQPFTYGDIAAAAAATANGDPQQQQQGKGTGMLKMESGLSSPSLVRKQLGAPQHKNVPVRNEFEEMLRMRREKVDNEKYSISDGQGENYKVSGSGGFSFEDKWQQQQQHQEKPKSPGTVTFKRTVTTTHTEPAGQQARSNGYVRSYEPVKRSNTMDYNRSQSSDGASWLQKQQQRLRAKKEQQSPVEDLYGRTSYERTYATTSRPGKLNASKRFDGYTSDTTFGDEIDYGYRRPYAQTPPPRVNNYVNGDAGRNYNTISTVTTTTKTVNNKERPFVAVRRAHEQSKQGYNIREESYSSYNEDLSPSLSSRPETPAFPVTPRTPYHYGRASPALPPKSPTTQRKDLHTGQHIHHVVNQNDSMSCYTSRRNSLTSNTNSEPQEVAPQHVKFVRDSSKFWYKPNITREEAATLLRHAPPGTFIVRDSKSFTNAFGLVLKVSQPPPNAAKVPPGDELVRHFLIEPTTRGVRLKGCANEPVFTSLSALVYQHSITPLALPCRLLIPDRDLHELFDVQTYTQVNQQRQLFQQGAACNVMFLAAVETESLTGPEAVRKAVSILFAKRPLPIPTQVHFKVTNQGVTLTDNTRQLFFRKHYPSATISYIAVDPEERRWSLPTPGQEVPVSNNRVFAFVARRAPSSMDNICHIFCELEHTQPAAAIVSFANNAILNVTNNGSEPAPPRVL